MSKLSEALRTLNQEIREARSKQDEDEVLRQLLSDAAELVNVLARIVQGKDFHAAFGAPGDWGYNTAIGQGLYELYSQPPALAVATGQQHDAA